MEDGLETEIQVQIQHETITKTLFSNFPLRNEQLRLMRKERKKIMPSIMKDEAWDEGGIITRNRINR